MMQRLINHGYDRPCPSTTHTIQLVSWRGGTGKVGRTQNSLGAVSIQWLIQNIPYIQIRTLIRIAPLQLTVFHDFLFLSFFSLYVFECVCVCVCPDVSRAASIWRAFTSLLARRASLYCTSLLCYLRQINFFFFFSLLPVVNRIQVVSPILKSVWKETQPSSEQPQVRGEGTEGRGRVKMEDR